jgi:hypothetical protein
LDGGLGGSTITDEVGGSEGGGVPGGGGFCGGAPGPGGACGGGPACGFGVVPVVGGIGFTPAR